MKKKSIVFFLFLLTIVICEKTFAQISVNKKIQFDSIMAGSRTIQGIVLANDSTSGIPYSAYIETDLNYISDATGGSVLNINIPSPVSVYSEGFELFIKASTSNSGTLFLNLNSLGAVEVKKPDTLSLRSNEIVAGQVFRVIYNGNYFIMQNPTVYKCPSGFASVNDIYCIEISERTGTSYLGAVSSCYSINARLCTWGEWYYACQKTSLGLINMTNNYEYVDDTCDHTNTVLIMGSGACTTYSTYAILGVTNYAYRCCYNK
jgi:hypothetical protein